MQADGLKGFGKPPLEEYHDRQVRVSPARSAAIAAERDVQVVPQKGAQGDVPAPPEIRDAVRPVGRIEVLDELDRFYEPLLRRQAA